MSIQNPSSPDRRNEFLTQWTTPDKEGTVTITASIEGVENSQKTISVTVENPRPDLIIQNIVPEPANPQEGEPLNFTVKVKNQGEFLPEMLWQSTILMGFPGRILIFHLFWQEQAQMSHFP